MCVLFGGERKWMGDATGCNELVVGNVNILLALLQLL